LLVRDGLHHDEIASCLSVSRRQVERLVEQARSRVGAATTSELVGTLVDGRLVPAPLEPRRGGWWTGNGLRLRRGSSPSFITFRPVDSD
jgi:hypothetical protein